jgi:hypothetical protein
LLADNTYLWDAASKRQLKEARLPVLNNTLLPGVYFDTTLITDSANALLGVPGKHYLLEIESGENHYSAITALLPTIPIDSLTSGGIILTIETPCSSPNSLFILKTLIP